MKAYLVLILTVFCLSVFAQDKTNNSKLVKQNHKKIYDASLDVEKQISEAVAKAKKENKHVLIQIGGNWCNSCIRMHKYFNTEKKVAETIGDNYVYIDVNYEPRNGTLAIFEKYKFPQRMAFPVIIILDQEGDLIHTQNTSLLEKRDEVTRKNGYNSLKVLRFLNNWTVKALSPDTYKR